MLPIHVGGRRCGDPGPAVAGCKGHAMSDVTLHMGDCLEFMRGLEPGGVSHVITDPPYEEQAHTPMRRTWAALRTNTNDVIDFSPIDDELRIAEAQQQPPLFVLDTPKHKQMPLVEA